LTRALAGTQHEHATALIDFFSRGAQQAATRYTDE